MKDILETICVVIFLSCLGYLLATYVSGKHQYDNSNEELLEYYKGRYDYMFKGANKRGYLDICKFPNGETKVVFKDECTVNE